MKILKYLSLILIAGMMFSCEKEMETQVVKQDVIFGINEVPNLKSDAFDIDCLTDGNGNLLEPKIAEIVINDGIADVTYYSEVFFLGGKLYTKAIQLDVPDKDSKGYTLKSFFLYTDMPASQGGNGIAIMATPAKGSDFEQFVTEGVEIDFTVNAFDKTEVDVDVLCFSEVDYEGFGFNWFEIHQVVVREVAFFGDLCIKDPADYKSTDEDNPTIYQQVFGDDLNGYVFDLPALFEIKLSYGGASHTFQNWDLTADPEFIAPLKVKYPDYLNKTDEFTFELWVYVRVGDDIEPKLIKTWNITDDEIIENTTPNGVVEFVIGGCNLNPAPETLIIHGYQNLPESANMTIATNVSSGHVYNGAGYWDVTVNSIIPNENHDFPSSGDMHGWCGDVKTIITAGTYNFHLYSSLNQVRPWPTGMPGHITMETLAKVNWLFNNLENLEHNNTNLGYPSLTGTYVTPSNLTLTTKQAKDLQHAIWLTMGQAANTWPTNVLGAGSPSPEAQSMASMASGHTDFKPLPGGYAAVLGVAVEDDPTEVIYTMQLIFTIVDP